MKCTNDPAVIEKEVKALYSAPTFSAQVIDAYKTYLRRKYGIEWPDGGSERDHRFYPSNKERCECCKNVHRPTRKYPFSLFKHCLTVIHIANLHGVEAKDLRKVINYYKEFEGQVSLLSKQPNSHPQRKALINSL